MDDVFKSFLVAIGFAADPASQAKAEAAQAGFEKTVTESDRRTTKARLREALIRGASDADTFEKRVKHAERLEEIDGKFGGLMLRRTLRQAAAQAKTNEERVKWLDRLQKAEADHHARLMSGLQRLAGVATTAAVAIQAATLALATYATHVAGKLEELAYSADRTGSSVASLKQFSLAVSQLGGTAGGALNDLENFAGKLRSNPQGYTAFLRSVGVDARDAQGNIRGAAELYKEFRKNVGERKPYEQQLLYAQEMGVSELTWRATDPTKLAAEEEAQRAKYGRMNYDPDKAAEGAKNLQRALRDMLDSIGIIGEKTASKIFGDIGDNLKGFTTFLEQHSDQIVELLSKIAQVVLEVSKALLELLTSPQVKAGLDWLLGMFGHVEEGSGRWIADTERIKLALEALAAFVATVFVAKITGAFAAILGVLGPLLVRLAPILGLAGLAGLAGSNGVLAGPGGSGSLGESALRTLDPGLADRVYGKTAEDKAATAKDDRTLWQRIAPKALGGRDAPGVGSEAKPLPIGKGAGVGHVASKEERAAYIRDAARRNGIDPDVALRVAQSEGFNVYAGDPDASGKPTSFGDFQLHYPGVGRNTADGLGTRFTKETGLDARDPSTWKEQIDFALKEAARSGWGAWHGAARSGIGNHQGIGVSPKASISSDDVAPSKKPGWIDKDTYTDGLNTFKRGEDGHLKRVTNIPGQPATLTDKAKELVGRVNDGVGRLDAPKLRGIGAATEGFDPSQYFKTAPPVGTSNTSSDNSVRHQSYRGGDTTVHITTTADARETHDLWRRHEARQRADDLRHASNVFAA